MVARIAWADEEQSDSDIFHHNVPFYGVLSLTGKAGPC